MVSSRSRSADAKDFVGWGHTTWIVEQLGRAELLRYQHEYARDETEFASALDVAPNTLPCSYRRAPEAAMPPEGVLAPVRASAARLAVRRLARHPVILASYRGSLAHDFARAAARRGRGSVVLSALGRLDLVWLFRSAERGLRGYTISDVAIAVHEALEGLWADPSLATPESVIVARIMGVSRAFGRVLEDPFTEGPAEPYFDAYRRWQEEKGRGGRRSASRGRGPRSALPVPAPDEPARFGNGVAVRSGRRLVIDGPVELTYRTPIDAKLALRVLVRAQARLPGAPQRKKQTEKKQTEKKQPKRKKKEERRT